MNLACTKLIAITQSRGILVRHLALEIGVCPDAMRHYVRGRSLPSIKAAYDIEIGSKGAISMKDWLQAVDTPKEAEPEQDT